MTGIHETAANVVDVFHDVSSVVILLSDIFFQYYNHTLRIFPQLITALFM